MWFLDNWIFMGKIMKQNLNWHLVLFENKDKQLLIGLFCSKIFATTLISAITPWRTSKFDGLRMWQEYISIKNPCSVFTVPIVMRPFNPVFYDCYISLLLHFYIETIYFFIMCNLFLIWFYDRSNLRIWLLLLKYKHVNGITK